jgi:hypothetical protein
MKFEVGDDIVVLHTNEEGKVTEIINDKMVMIEVRGVKFPSYIDQIDFPYFKRFTQNKPPKKKEKKFIDDIPKEKSKSAEARVSEGMWLSLIPKFTIDEFGDEVVELFKLYLVNKTGRGYKFVYHQLFFGEEDFELINEVTAFHDFYLHDISFSNFNDNPSFNFAFSLITPDKTKADFFEASSKIKPKQLFQRIEEMKQKNEPTINYKLFEVYPDKVFDEKLPLSTHAANEYAIYEAKKAREHLQQPRSVIDLHMEKLTDDWQHMSNFEILTLQLKEFEKWYDLAVAHHLPNFTVIHGVGSGKLRDEIHEILKTKNEVKYFINQYDPRFGYGATEIFFAASP